MEPTEHSPHPKGRPPGEREAAELRFKAEVERNLKRNFLAHIAHGMLGQTGFRIIQAPTFLPAYVFALSGSNALVGVARACQALGMFITPILGASLIEHRRRVRPMVFLTGAAMRVQVLGLALAGYFLGASSNLWAICIFLGLFGVFTGMQTVTFQFLISKIIPLERRGSLVGLRNALSGLCASAVSAAGGYFVANSTLGNGYATTFLVAFALTTTGLMAVLLMREPESPEIKPQAQLGSRFRELPALLREHPDFRWYIAARALGITGMMSHPYFVLYAADKLDAEQGLLLATLSPAYMLAQTGASLFWGVLADRRGFRDVLWLSLVTWVGATVLALGAESLTGFILAFVGLGMGHGGFQLATTSLVLEFGQREDLPMRIAVAQSGEQLVSIVAPLAGGLIAQSGGYVALFCVSASLQTLAALITLRKVAEPRRRRAAPTPTPGPRGEA